MWIVKTTCMIVMFIASYCSDACLIKTRNESKRRTLLTFMYYANIIKLPQLKLYR